MYGAIREYKLQPGKIDEIIRKVRDDFAPMLSKAPGFVVYTLVQVGSDDIVTTSVFENQAGAEESVKTAAGWVRENIAASVIGTPRVTTGEFMIREVKEGGKAGYGVMRRFELKRENAEEMVRRARAGLVPQMTGMPGFLSYGLLLESGHERGASLSAFADRATAEAANQRALAWIKENLGDMVTKPIDIIQGEIKLRHTRTAVGAR
jgi:heme-degrading monooxygenase HmoA